MTRPVMLWGMGALALLFSLALLIPLGAAVAADTGAILQSLAAERAEKTPAIEDQAGAHPLDSFYAALARTAAKQPGAITRICHFGDSLIEMDLVSGQARRRMQMKWGDAGHGWVNVSRPQPWYRPYDVLHAPAASWIAYALYDSSQKDRRFGLGGALSFAYKAKAEAVFGTSKKGQTGRSVSRFQILYPVDPQNGPLEVEVDGKRLGLIPTTGSPARDAYTEVAVADGAHELTLVAPNKGTRAYGVILERDVPGVVYDALGTNGVGAGALLTNQRDHINNMLRHPNPNLVILSYGGNEARSNFAPEQAKKDLLEDIAVVRQALPNVAILVTSPNDSALKQGPNLVSDGRVQKVAAKQKEAAAEAKVAYWSIFEAMGGDGAMARWYQASPRLGAGDLLHPTPEGGVVLGNLLYNALMQDFAAYLQRGGGFGAARPATASPLQKINLQ